MKRLIFALVVHSIAAVAFICWSIFADHTLYKEGLSSFDGLPSSASDISVSRNQNISGLFVSDFRIAESDFVSFAVSNHWDLQTIAGSAYVYEARALKDGTVRAKKEITNGWFFSRRNDSGAGVDVAYDRKDGRAYVNRSSR